MQAARNLEEVTSLPPDDPPDECTKSYIKFALTHWEIVKTAFNNQDGIGIRLIMELMESDNRRWVTIQLPDHEALVDKGLIKESGFYTRLTDLAFARMAETTQRKIDLFPMSPKEFCAAVMDDRPDPS